MCTLKWSSQNLTIDRSNVGSVASQLYPSYEVVGFNLLPVNGKYSLIRTIKSLYNFKKESLFITQASFLTSICSCFMQSLSPKWKISSWTVQQPMPSTNFSVVYLCYTEIKHSDWVFQVTWQFIAQHSAFSAQHRCDILKLCVTSAPEMSWTLLKFYEQKLWLTNGIAFFSFSSPSLSPLSRHTFS